MINPNMPTSVNTVMIIPHATVLTPLHVIKIVTMFAWHRTTIARTCPLPRRDDTRPSGGHSRGTGDMVRGR